MSDELKEWCSTYNFSFEQFVSLDLTIEKLLSTKSTIVLAEELGLKTSSERGRLIDGIKELRNKSKEEEAYNDPEVIVKGDDDYNEFENEKEEQKSMHEESFMLRSNVGDDPTDQWDIVSFFDNNEQFKKFKPILLLQMQIQNSANYNGNNGMGNQNDQLDHLLDSMLGGPHENDSSSDSDDDLYGEQQLVDSNTFREYIQMGYMPTPVSLIYDNVLNKYSFDSQQEQKEETDEKQPFNVSIGYCEPKDYQSNALGDSNEYFLSIGLGCNGSAVSNYKRYKSNIVIVLETLAFGGDGTLAFGDGGSLLNDGGGTSIFGGGSLLNCGGT